MIGFPGSTRRAAGGAALLAAAAAAVVILGPTGAAALEKGPWTMEVLVNGSRLEEHAARGATYLEAIPGREYVVRITNNTPERVAVALSVDGLNSIDAKTTTARSAARWILGPWQSITLEGWQTGPSTARRFFFTTEPRSYGAWLGETRNLGVISAAVFRERRPRVVPYWIVPNWKDRAPMDAPAPPAPESNEAGPQSAPGAGRSAGAMAAPSDDYAATGIGREVGNEVTRVPFDAEPSPAAVLDLRYEYRDALVRLGVLPRAGARCPGDRCDDPLARRECARGFESMEFAPDPWRPRCP